ncbi:branched-chain amino acid aminotransferase II [Tilletiopsis washingtonensis]|uniref:Branched-chain amino acid aminotransferase II n=1 Tax=Tilletiopsis washingtonensis TaxID=58919 RepID=A0A316ZJT5_9BASI|nr:branched-chain amino acid aminotransferase II [Tilletiopsis washingtonensis]PWO01399.1 branched-chain amino acid aminotransferase II [Tilletiopsis washingtonensis]
MSRPAPPPTSAIDWATLGFTERRVAGQVVCTWRDGAWGAPTWSSEPELKIHAAASCLNYGQQCFEGIKAFRTKAGSVHIFRPHANSARINLSARTASMPTIPQPLFLDALRKAVAGNLEFVPPYGPNASAGALYLRPLLIATGPSLILGPPKEFMFVVWCTPVGSLYGTGGALPAIDAFVLDTFDRSAPNGTGHTKLGGNYAPVFGPTAAAKAQGYPITLHLDSANHTHVDEFSTSNALALASKDGKQTLVVPESPSILRSVTKLSVCDLARRMGWTVERRPLAFDEVKRGDFVEFMAAGTAAGITPVRSISYNTKQPVRKATPSTNDPEADEQAWPEYEDAPDNEVKRIAFGDGKTAGENAVALWKELTSYQCGDLPDEFGWNWPKEGIVAEDAIRA